MRQTLHLDSDQIVALHDPPAAMQDEVARDPYDMHRLVENRLYLSALLAVIFGVGSITVIARLDRCHLQSGRPPCAKIAFSRAVEHIFCLALGELLEREDKQFSKIVRKSDERSGG